MLRDIGLSSLKERRPRVDLINIYKYLEGGCKENGTVLFSVVPRNRTRGSGHKLKYKWFRLNIRKSFCTVWVMEQGNRLPSEVVGSCIVWI